MDIYGDKIKFKSFVKFLDENKYESKRDYTEWFLLKSAQDSIKQTIIPIKTKKEHYLVPLKDGGQVCYHFYAGDKDKPLLIIFVTVNGHAEKYNIIVNHYLNQKWNIAIFNRRGMHCPLTTPHLYTSGNDSDNLQVFDHLLNGPMLNQSSIYLAGFSAGGIIMLRFLGKVLSQHPKYKLLIKKACCISGAVHTGMFESMNHEYAIGIYEMHKSKLVKYLFENPHKYDTIKDLLFTSGEHIRSYLDEECKTYPMEKSEYLDDQLVQHWIPFIQHPTLIINAKDDQICLNPHFYIDEVLANDNLLYVITEHGGHLSFTHGKECWTDNILIKWIQNES